MCSIIDIVYSPYLDLEITDLLRNLITEHHKLFLNLLPNSRLVLKFHLMLQYPDILSSSGPLSLFKDARFESKHNLFKQIANLSNTFRNLPQTLIKREQLRFAARLISDAGFDVVPEAGKIGQKVHITKIKKACQFLSISPIDVDQVIAVNTISVFGTRYDKTMTLTVDFGDNIPIFGEIELILIDGNDRSKVYFMGKKFIVDDFDELSCLPRGSIIKMVLCYISPDPQAYTSK